MASSQHSEADCASGSARPARGRKGPTTPCCSATLSVPRKRVRRRASAVAACAMPWSLHFSLRCASTTWARSRCTRSLASSALARFDRCPVRDAMRRCRNGGYGPARSIPSSWFDSSTSRSAPAHSDRTFSLTCPISVHTTAVAPVERHARRTPIGLAASCGVCFVVTSRRDKASGSSAVIAEQPAPRSSGHASMVPALAYSAQPHLRAPAAAPFT
jgi:hypothetical protein